MYLVEISVLLDFSGESWDVGILYSGGVVVGCAN